MKERIPFPESQESHAAALRENPSIEAPVETPTDVGVENSKPPHAAVEAPTQDPAHELIARERDSGAQVTMQTQVLVQADS